MATNPNMVAIQTVTVGSGGAANIEFTNIPQTYTDLQLVVSSRATATDTPVKVEFNNVTTGYSWRRIYGSGSAASSLSGTDAYYFWTATSSQTASTFGSGQLYIPNYTSSNNKSISTESLNENNGTAADMFMTAALWSNSAAITSIKLTPLTGNFAQYSTATLYGVTSVGTAAKATGGIITQDANYFYHTFLSSGTFTPTSNITADYLVVAGGGGGGSDSGGGGGAGGLRCTVTATGGGGSLPSAVSLTNGTAYTVTVGAGGAGGVSGGAASAQGSSSSIAGSGLSTITTTGGGRGGTVNGQGGTGGSGGGAGAAPGGIVNAAGTANEGYAGGSANQTDPFPTGGGGGAGATGGNGTSTTSGSGGAGVTTSITGSSVTYAGGGGGGSTVQGATAGTGGSGGGGNGATSTVVSSAGTANTGGGGGAGRNSAGYVNGSAGGSGIVVIRYAR